MSLQTEGGSTLRNYDSWDESFSAQSWKRICSKSKPAKPAKCNCWASKPAKVLFLRTLISRHQSLWSEQFIADIFIDGGGPKSQHRNVHRISLANDLIPIGLPTRNYRAFVQLRSCTCAVLVEPNGIHRSTRPSPTRRKSCTTLARIDVWCRRQLAQTRERLF